MAEREDEHSIWKYNEHTLIKDVEYIQDRIDQHTPDVIGNMTCDALFMANLIKKNVITKQAKHKIMVGQDLSSALIDCGH